MLINEELKETSPSFVHMKDKKMGRPRTEAVIIGVRRMHVFTLSPVKQNKSETRQSVTVLIVNKAVPCSQSFPPGCTAC